MKLGYNLNLSQTQKLVMTPELKQAIEILQYNTVELNEFISNELLENPVLQKEPQEANKDKEFDVEAWKEIAKKYNQSYTGGEGKVNYNDDDDVNYDNLIASEINLLDFLVDQLQYTPLTEEQKIVGEYLIYNINANGYLACNNMEIGYRFGISEDDVEDIIYTIQTFEPFGVGARDLRECLLIQMSYMPDIPDLAFDLVENYLEDLGNNRMSKISKELEVPIKAIQDAMDVIRTLEPKPGRKYASSRNTRYVTPDVYIEKIDDEYVVLVNDSTAPKLRISQYYQSLLNGDTVNEQASEYIAKKLNSALKLIKSIEQRRSTIYKVVKAILEYQKDFFEKGMVHLKTLNLKDVADEIGVHESTVSRAINGKYVQCPNGLYEIKFFFQSGVKSSYGSDVSSESIKSMIKDMVDAENQKKPISDQFIADELNKLGINIKRRTVAKYRDELGILSSSKRKRY